MRNNFKHGTTTNLGKQQVEANYLFKDPSICDPSCTEVQDFSALGQRKRLIHLLSRSAESADYQLRDQLSETTSYSLDGDDQDVEDSLTEDGVSSLSVAAKTSNLQQQTPGHQQQQQSSLKHRSRHYHHYIFQNTDLTKRTTLTNLQLAPSSASSRPRDGGVWLSHTLHGADQILWSLISFSIVRCVPDCQIC